jgi:hypothetical protein
MSFLSGYSLTFIAAIMAVCLIAYQIYDNRSLRRIDSTFSLKRFAWVRTSQLIALMVLVLSLSTYQELQLSKARFDLERLESSQLQVDEILAAINQPADAAPPPASVEAKALPERAKDPITEIYAVDSSKQDKQSKLDTIKNRYEEILVTHFFLRKCHIAPADDYHVIMSALAVEMASANAQGRLQYDILTAAKGSFREMYSKSSCDEQSTGTLRESYASYISSISKNVVTP